MLDGSLSCHQSATVEISIVLVPSVIFIFLGGFVAIVRVIFQVDVTFNSLVVKINIKEWKVPIHIISKLAFQFWIILGLSYLHAHLQGQVRSGFSATAQS